MVFKTVLADAPAKQCKNLPHSFKKLERDAGGKPHTLFLIPHIFKKLERDADGKPRTLFLIPLRRFDLPAAAGTDTCPVAVLCRVEIQGIAMIWAAPA
jgi:hypothetical protein